MNAVKFVSFSLPFDTYIRLLNMSHKNEISISELLRSGVSHVLKNDDKTKQYKKVVRGKEVKVSN